MPTAATVLTKAVRDVERLAQLQDDSVAARNLAASIMLLMEQWHSLPPMSVPELQVLVDKKVPLRLATACSRVAQAAPRSLAACAAFDVLEAFLSRTAPLCFYFKHSATTLDACMAQGISPAQEALCLVLVGIRAQLLQSGLLASVSGVLTAAAEDLPSQQPQQGHGAARYCVGRQQHGGVLAHFQHQLLQHCGTLLQAWSDLCLVTQGSWVKQASLVHACSSGADSMAGGDSLVQGEQQFQASKAASSPAAIQLAAAVMDLVSQRNPQLVAADRKAVRQAVRGDSATSMSAASCILGSAYAAVAVVATVASYVLATGSGAAAGVSSEACLPDFIRLHTFVLFIICKATLLHDRTASTAASTDRSGSSSNAGGVPTSSTQSGASSQADKPRAVSRRHLRAAHKALSPCDTALLQLLRFSSEAVVWVAATLVQRSATTQVACNAQALLVALKGSTGAAQQHAPAQQQLLVQLLLLVPAMLLSWAAQATSNTAVSQADVGPLGLDPQMLASFSNFRIAEQRADIDSTVSTALFCILQWQQHIASHRSSPCANSSTAGSSVWLQQYPPAEWLQQVFPDIHTICSARVVARSGAPVPMQAPCSSILVEFQAQLIAWAAQFGSQSDVAAAGAQPGNSSHKGTEAQQQQQQPSQPAQQGTASDTCSTKSGSGSSSSSWFEPPQPLPAALAAFQGVALQTIASFDGFARSAARQLEATQRAATQSVEEAVSSITGLCFSEGRSRPGPLLALVQAAGPGCREQQALSSCLRSIVKLTAVCVAAGEQDWAPLFSEVALAAMLLLAPPASEQTGRASAAAGGSSTQSPAPAATPTATVYLPSLVLLGCAFQFWAQGLQDDVPTPQRLLQLAPSSMDLERLVQCVLDWLADSSVMQQVAAAGYGVQQLPVMLQGLLAAQAAARRSMFMEGCIDIETALAGLQAELEAAGAALSALATPAFCNNSTCQNVSGPTELSLVSGRSCLCGGCCVARYCSRACQRAHWAQHKPVCKALAAAGTTAGPALQQQQQPAVIAELFLGWPDVLVGLNACWPDGVGLHASKARRKFSVLLLAAVELRPMHLTESLKVSKLSLLTCKSGGSSIQYLTALLPQPARPLQQLNGVWRECCVSLDLLLQPLLAGCAAVVCLCWWKVGAGFCNEANPVRR